MSHIPVLLKEAINSLHVKENGVYVDCTFGGGGHSKRIADLGGRVIALDADPDAVKRLPEEYKDKVNVVHANFERIEDVITELGVAPVQGVLFDLGLSSFQLAHAERGFAFMLKGPLDMRFNFQSASHTAGALLDILPEDSLTELFINYGDEVHARKIAHKIKSQNIKQADYWQQANTGDLAGLVEQLIPRQGKLHPATKVFQALRMAVNDEPGVLSRGLDGARAVISNLGGRVVVIAFHSIEDRIVKQRFQLWEAEKIGKMIGDVKLPSGQEIEDNPRARSAKMRVFEFGAW